jgi:hypothetical protein
MTDLITGLTPEQKRLIDAYHATAEDDDCFVPAGEILKDVALRQLGWSEELFEAELGGLIAHVAPRGSYPPGHLGFYYRELLALTQPWRCRYPLFDSKGMPIGELHDDEPSGPEYVEICLSKAAHLLMPRRSPPLLPISLLNGSAGSEGTLIPPHNLYELWIAQEQVRQDPKISLDDLMETIPGPDFPVGSIASGPEEIRTLYEKGRGRITLRAVIDEEIQGPRTRVAITSLPPGVLIRQAIEKISALSRSGRLRLYNIHNASRGDRVRIMIDAPNAVSTSALKRILYQEAGLERLAECRIVPEEPVELPTAACALASVLLYAAGRCSPAWERKDGERLDRVPTLKEVLEFGGYKSSLSELVDPRRTRILKIE